MASEEKLFQVRFIMDDFADAQGKEWKGVPITLLIDEDNREPLVPYEVGIKDYESDPAKEHALRSLFSEDEALRLANYIKEHDGFETEIVEVELPLDSLWPWYKEMNPAQQGFIGVSESICSYMELRIAAYFDVRDSITWKETNA
ncbi:hypothetical protein ACFL6S_30655 [Candidatus Poribacteria bacterium]